MVARVLVLVLFTVSADANRKEYVVRAGLLYNLAAYTTWPKKALPEKKPLVIAIVGKDPFGSILDKLAGRTIKGHRIVIKRFKDARTIGPCHVLYVAGKAEKRVREIRNILAGKPVLTVSAVDRFAHRGGMVRMFRRNKTIRLEFNVSAQTRVGLRIHPKVLRLGKKVDEG